MEFGLFHEFPSRSGGTDAQAFAEGFELVDDAERLGLDAIWLAELHVTPRSVLAAPMTIASAIAARTERVKIGVAVQVLPLGNPLRIAEEASTVDHISRGRLIFGVGRSGVVRSYQAYGIPYAESKERFGEALDIILKAWTEVSFSYEGRWHTYQDVHLTPKPYQRPHPPVRVAVNSPESFAHFGSQGHAVFVAVRQGELSQLEPLIDAYRQAYRSGGHPGNGGVYIRIPIYVAESEAAALTEPEESVMDFFRTQGSQTPVNSETHGVTDERLIALRQRLLSITWQEVLQEKVIVGRPEVVAERLAALRDRLGLDGVLAEFNCGGKIPHHLVKRSMRLFCEHVLPAFRR
jgi:alkanesulfonate monooxygenase SsuD/methylene tetrahydromethanopterin reductase-like flavin-dependent oxidoreductase (luciferase family)